MSCPLCFHIPKALPSIPFSQFRIPSLSISSDRKIFQCSKPNKSQTLTGSSRKPISHFQLERSSLAIQVGVLLAAIAQPASAVTGENSEVDLIWVLIQLGIAAFGYFIVIPPIIMNWLRIRWYRRNLLEMYLQFMCVFIFFPGVMLWAPFLNFRKFPRDPSMKYPWSTPQDPSQIKNAVLKYPWAKAEDYD